MRHPLIDLFHLSNLLEMLNEHRMIFMELFGNFSSGFKRISFDNLLNWLLSTSDGWPLHCSTSWLSSPLQNFLNHYCTIHSLAVPGLNVLLILRVVFAVLRPIWTWIRKSLEFAFCLTSFPWSKINLRYLKVISH